MRLIKTYLILDLLPKIEMLYNIFILCISN